MSQMDRVVGAIRRHRSETGDMDKFWGLSGTAWTAIYTLITFGLLVVAVLAAIYAKRQWDTNKDQAESARRAQLEASRPYVIATVQPSAASRHLFDLEVRNIGRRPALNVTLRLDPPPKRARETEGLEIAKIKMLNEPITMIAPDQKLRAFYDNHIERKDAEDLPSSHEVSLTYEDTSGRTYTEHSVIDLEAMRGTMFTDVKTVHNIGKSLDEIGKILKAASVLDRHGTLDVEAATETRESRGLRVERENYEALVQHLHLVRRVAPDSSSTSEIEAKIADWEARRVGSSGPGRSEVDTPPDGE
ncbi:hypothetical protein [Leekyejoonella antrihumi]|uniref:Uncharacterized protein n=1 Tax=Leekyejoonella antrihumi TaxID=1660198 RepID=A0A563DRF3_9MICO|nr:hypothetical protein [Leekyejoonella antrihumi]TWP32858.1 hypothetical protein FGL98_23110 [Leekyejoonella antrihumi]